MLGELVVITQAVGIEHFVVVHDDGVVHATTQCQPVGTHHFHVLGEAEGARAGNVAAVLALAQVKFDGLPRGIDGRMGKVNFKPQLVAVVGVESRPLGVHTLALANFYRLFDPNEAPRGVLQNDARTLQKEDERSRRPVQDGHLFGSDVYIQVVHPQPGTR